MKIFLSWSGPRSGAVAEALKEYLPMINNAFDPWLSFVNIDKGSRSTAEIADALATAKAGIICLTPNNLNEPWLLYEAGGIAKTVEKPLACTLLIDLKPSDVPKPLGDFQHTKLTKAELLQLIKTLNKATGEAALESGQIEKVFNVFWPDLKKKFDELPADGSKDRQERTEEDLQAEVLDTVRTLQQDTVAVKQAEQRSARDIKNIAAKLDSIIFTPGPFAPSPFAPGTVLPLSSLNPRNMMSANAYRAFYGLPADEVPSSPHPPEAQTAAKEPSKESHPHGKDASKGSSKKS